MNKKTFWTTLGLSALGVALIALPGSSANRQEGNDSAARLARLQEKLRDLKVNGQALTDDKQVLIAQLQDKARELAEFEAEVVPGTQPGEEDLQTITINGGWLGVGVSEISSSKAKELKLPAERGALLGKVMPDSPAAKAGLKQDDVVTEINGQRIEGTAQFRRMIHEIPAGRTAQLTVWRDGRSQAISVTIGKSDPRGSMAMSMAMPGSFAFTLPEVRELPDTAELGDVQDFALFRSAQPRLGIDAENLEGDFGNYFGAPDGEGVLVRSVFENTPAAKAGLKAGDVITAVNGDRIRSISELREKLIADKETKSLKLGLLRNKAELSVNVEVPAAPKRHEHRVAPQRTNI
jgi:C-terminal processing protease CtpA/Prc